MNQIGNPHEQLVTEIYDEQYAAQYPAMYIAPWRRTHALNEQRSARSAGMVDSVVVV